MITLVFTLIIIAALLLIVVAALQNSKKEGGGNALGSMGAHQIIGVKRTGDILEQTTWGLLIALFVLSMSTFVLLKKGGNVQQSPNLERIEQQSLLMTPSKEEPSLPTATPDNKEQEIAKDK